jgi:CBS-domain-containing membrane protein
MSAFFVGEMARGLSKMKAHQIMTGDVITVPEDATVEMAAHLLAKHRLNTVPVINQAGELLGMVDMSDLFPRLKDMRFSGQRMATLFNSLVNLADLPEFYWHTRDYPVANIMNRFVPSINASDDLEQVASQFLYNDYRTLPVIADGKLVGMISLTDLLKLAIVSPERE